MKIAFQTLFLCYLVCLSACQSDKGLLIEAESFTNKGAWLVDPQFVEQMGSPYLLAHGMGTPVASAETQITLGGKGRYHVWARTHNWAPGNWDAPGQFCLEVNEVLLPNNLGMNPDWNWEYAGEVQIENLQTKIVLKDLTGFDGRCDAIWISKKMESPPNDPNLLKKWRSDQMKLAPDPEKSAHFDLVVVGGGIAGCAAAIAAAEQGLKVALIHDRPVLGGNASSEIRVHTLGIYGKYERILKMLDTEHYPNGSPESLADEQKRQQNMNSFTKIKQFLNWRAYDAHSESSHIQYIDAKHTETGERMRFTAPNFVDCTGDGWIGYWAGASYYYGREEVSAYQEGWEKYGETWSPSSPDNRIMGSSVLWRTKQAEEKTTFPEVPWALEVASGYSASAGTWNWEFITDDYHQIDDGEYIRDHMLKAIYGSFFNEKQKTGNDLLQLEWVSYLLGKRESRRLLGDYFYTFNDARENRQFPDSVVVEVREIDVHYAQQSLFEEKPDFLSEAMYFKAGRYYIPYRSLYSKDIDNLFMAGRCFSCSHIGLGGPRVMRTTGQMGASVGIAAALCKKYSCSPRSIYTDHLDEYWILIQKQQ